MSRRKLRGAVGTTGFSVGEIAQLRARATWSDGREEDMTSRARWSSRTLTCIVTAAGVATALETGECSISASVESFSAAADVTIRPSRVYTISGVVREQYGFREPPIPGAVVRIATGSLAGRTVTTDALGRYQLPDVPRDRVALRVEASGFESTSKDATPEAATLDILLAPLTATLSWDSRQHPDPTGAVIPFRVSHRGPATLTVFASGHECGTYETYWAGVRAAGSIEPRLGAYPCRAGVAVTTSATLDPGAYEFVVWRHAFAHDPGRVNTAELIHPR